MKADTAPDRAVRNPRPHLSPNAATTLASPTGSVPPGSDFIAVLSADNSDVLIRLKVVPGSSRDALAGVLGDRLKIKVTAAPEAGKANAAVCQLLAHALGLKPRDVTIEIGATAPEKIARVRGIGLKDAATRLGVST